MTKTKDFISSAKKVKITPEEKSVWVGGCWTPEESLIHRFWRYFRIGLVIIAIFLTAIIAMNHLYQTYACTFDCPRL